ncbi:MAG: lectin-like protein [Luteolibacter sp.]|uniref:lectin-like protein n=1 Tax=Luteolibacter sp. TaxID=1962973 RepID=UPI003263D5C3
MKPTPFLLIPLALKIGAMNLAAQVAPHDPYFTAPFGPGGTWNLYQFCSAPLTWTQAQEMAEKMSDPLGKSGKMGHLAAIGSAAENEFVYRSSESKFLWIGLTDNERWKGSEAGSDRRGKWAWVTGEPVTFSLWRSPEPNEASAGGEDAVAIEQGGRWADWGMGSAGQGMNTHPSMIEWEVNSKEPVSGAFVMKPALPKKWPIDFFNWKGEVQGKGPWTIFGASDLDGGSYQAIEVGLFEAMKKATVLYRLPRLNYRWPGTPLESGGWMEVPDRPLHPVREAGCGAVHFAKAHFEKPGTWSFNIHADDYFAIRLPGRKWKSVTGMGGIDPLDPEVIYFRGSCGDANAIGVIDLPAGDQVIEVMLGNQEYETMIQLLAAPGEFTMDGGTDRWRFPGHKAAGDLALPGIDSAGWSVTRTDRPAGGAPVTDLASGLILSSLGEGKPTEGVEKINYIDSNAAGDIKFPNPSDFPGDAQGGQDAYVIRATGNLVIPRDGIYHIGVHAEDHCALRIIGRNWSSIVRNTGYTAAINGDTIFAESPDVRATNAQFVGAIELPKGIYQIEALYVETDGTSVFSVFAAPPSYAPRLLAKDGAKIEPDFDGLPLLDTAR